MKKPILLLLLIITMQGLNAQEYYITNQYVHDLFLVNPAAASSNRDCMTFNGYFQKQWFGIDNSPSTQLISFQTALTKQLGSGTYVYNDQNGLYKQIGLQQSLSYEVLLSKSKRRVTTLLFGLSVNAHQRSLGQSDLAGGAAADPAMMNGDYNGMGFNANSGVILRINQTHAGISVTNLLGQTNKMYDSNLEPNLAMDINFHIATLFKLSDRELYLEPLLYFRKNANNGKLDFNLKLNMPTPNPELALWGVLAYRRSFDSKMGVDLGTAVALGVIRNRISAGIEYQLGLTSAQQYFGSSYQFLLGYRICRDRSKGAIACPKRYSGLYEAQ